MEHASKTKEAKALHLQGNLEQAEALYRAALASEPADLEALEGLGVLAFHLGRTDEARSLFARGVALRPRMPRFRANLAETLRLLGRRDEAAAEVRAALTLNARLPQAWNTQALLAHDEKRYADALEAAEEAIRLQPAFAAGHINRGIALVALERRSEAIEALRAALRIEPDNLTAHTNLGQALAESGDPAALDEAEVHCRRAVELAPRVPEMMENLGHVLQLEGRLSEAVEWYKQALAAAPRRVPVRRSMGELAQQTGRYDEAERWLRSALAIDPNDARTHAALGSLSFLLERYSEAIRHYRKAVALDPGLAEAHYGLGLALQEQDRPQEAELCYRAAIRSQSTLTTPLLALARLQSERGERALSSQTARQALALRPNLSEAYWRLAMNHKAELPDADIEAMERLLGQKHLSHGLLAALHFGLATVYDARGRFREAAAHMDAANALQAAVKAAKNQSYDPDQHSRSIDRLISAFSPEFLSHARTWGDPDPRPVFVLGLPRSGTTLVEQILASHSQVYGAGELRDALRLFNALPHFVGAPAADAFDCIARLGPDAVRSLARKYLDRLQALAPPGAARVVDKMPDNFKLLGLIGVFWPNAHVILCIRDLRDIAVSAWQTSFSSNPWTNSWEHIARRFADHHRLLAHWRRTQPIRWLEVVYEDLVQDVAGHARRLIDFVGLEWEPACLEFHKTRRVVRTASQHQVREPVHAHSVGRWRNYESMIAPLVDAMNRYGVAPGAKG
jgi:tetratricopeptide (TPR) repeat protein